MDRGQLQGLARQFDALVEGLNKCPNLIKRKDFLRRMRALIEKIDALILSDLERDDQETTSCYPQPTNPQPAPQKPSSQNVMARWK